MLQNVYGRWYRGTLIAIKRFMCRVTTRALAPNGSREFCRGAESLTKKKLVDKIERAFLLIALT